MGIAIADCLASTSLRLTREAASVMGELLPGEARTEWRELENKLHAFEWFTFAGARLGGPVQLVDQVRRAAALPDPFTGLWATEGLGYAYALAGTNGADGEAPRRLLAADRLAGLPDRALVPTRTGSALAVAERLLTRLDRGAGGDRALVWRWLEHCQDGARPGFRELAVEALGLVARQLQPYRLGGLDELLAAADPVLPEYFWHGVGRGLYFAPTHLMPWSAGWGRAFAKALSEPRRASGRVNAVAGLGWALTLVNLRSPAIVEAAVWGCGDSPEVAAGFANGATCALLVWRHWAGAGEGLLDRFLDHRPPGSAGLSRRWHRWRRWIVDPCRAALAASGRDLRRQCDLAALFRLQEAS